MIYLLGDITCREGTYMLLIELKKTCRVSFGRFMGGKAITMDAGLYLYTGSAMGGTKAGSPLWRRLLRHATRSSGRRAHAVRKHMLIMLNRTGMNTQHISAPSKKKLRWHIDYLLDKPCVRLSGAIVICSPARLESLLAQKILSLDCVIPVAQGLGASDMKKETHLVRLEHPDRCLQRLNSLLLTIAEIREHNYPFPINAFTNVERSKI
ncbi:MAG TPA: GIY-YIG nuclease family protein [Prosthecochloris aestuarii]|uniref:GIY-YIG nuclease family protein n=1 Tax=Prosthecochloris aestuarii TaxID=1102 RepID=A0A831SRU3_PROAE|nr:GIY-YIG nuclease family protein [Prosthecochloris aestuarii]